MESLEKLILKETDFSTYELEHLDIMSLLFQTGYLTIKDYEKTIGEETIYHLSYPNREVENAFMKYFQKYWLKGKPIQCVGAILILNLAQSVRGILRKSNLHCSLCYRIRFWFCVCSK